jgi:hypothetical protein
MCYLILPVNRQPERPLILLWNELWPSPFLSEKGSYAFAADGCPVRNCETTFDKSRLGQASLLVTHAYPHLNVSALRDRDG